MRPPSKPPPLRDGIYQVASAHFCAGFVIENGRVTQCAPILRKRLDYWFTLAERIGPAPHARDERKP